MTFKGSLLFKIYLPMRIYYLIVKSINPWAASDMNMGERGDILDWYGDDQLQDPMYLDEIHNNDLERPEETEKRAIFSKGLRFQESKRAMDNYRMNHLVRFTNNMRRMKKDEPDYISRQLRSSYFNLRTS